MKPAVTSRIFLFLVSFLSVCFGFAQCPSGAIGISGGGCMSGCNLTSVGGPNCSPPVTGNATTATVFTDIAVPNGCTFTVTATMMNRPGACSASGADAGDGMKVDIPGGPKPFQTGAANATLNDSYVLVGPGTVRVSCTANRQDEIVTYSVSSSGALCTACMSVLPIELSAFDAIKGTDYVDLVWTTESERDNDFFTLERSPDGKLFEPIGTMDGAGNSTGLIHYTSRDISPLEGISYYRLRQTDFNGKVTDSEIRSVSFGYQLEVYPNPADEQFVLAGNHLEHAIVSLSNSLGQEVSVAVTTENQRLLFDATPLPEGIYFLTIEINGEVLSVKCQ